MHIPFKCYIFAMVKHYIFEAAFIRTGLVKLIDGVNAVCFNSNKAAFFKITYGNIKRYNNNYFE